MYVYDSRSLGVYIAILKARYKAICVEQKKKMDD